MNRHDDWTIEDAIRFILGDTDLLDYWGENKGFEECGRFQTIKSLDPAISDALLAANILAKGKDLDLDWLIAFEYITAGNKEFVLRKVMGEMLRYGRIRQLGGKAILLVWLYSACEAARRYGLAIDPEWIDKLRQEVNKQKEISPLVNKAQEWLNHFS